MNINSTVQPDIQTSAPSDAEGHSTNDATGAQNEQAEEDEDNKDKSEKAAEDEEEESDDPDDLSTQQLQSGSDLTVQVDVTTGHMLDNWCDADEIEDVFGENGDKIEEDEHDVDSDKDSDWGSDKE